MDTNFVYWPYDEVSVSLSEDQQQVVVSCPWIEATVPVAEYDQDALTILLEKFSTQTLNPAEDLELINAFFINFHEFPFCYILPAPKMAAAEELDTHKIKNQDLLSLSMTELLNHTIKESDTSLTPEDVSKCLSMLPRDSWAWDAGAAAAFSSFDDQVHPEGVFSVARRFHYLEVVDNSQSLDLFQDVENLEGDEFRRAARLLVRQNHYVTQRCDEALRPALDTAGKARALVEDFIKEEQGHDLILGVAMKAMAEDPESVPATSSTKVLMHLLRYAAGRNFLAFAMAVDGFERSSYEKVDPLAGLLIKGGFEKAANQINRHMQINDAGGHENVACGFLNFMAPTDQDYAIEALRIAELTTLVMNSIILSAISVFKDESDA